jgi:hypothetical protein
MKRATTILATVALGAMLATGSATMSMARGGGGGHGGGGHGGDFGGGHSESMGNGGGSGGVTFSNHAANVGGVSGADGHGYGRDHRRGSDVYEDGYCGYPYPDEEFLGFFCP